MVEVIGVTSAGKKFSLEDKIRLCKAWNKTKLSRSAFMREHDLPKTFHNWCNKFLTTLKPIKNKNKTGSKITKQWIPIISKPDNNNTHTEEKQEEQARNLKLYFKLAEVELTCCMSIEQAIVFIKELSHATTVIR